VSTAYPDRPKYQQWEDALALADAHVASIDIRYADLFCRGHYNYFLGVRVQQMNTALFMLERLLSLCPYITRVVELGTAQGGLATFFGAQMYQRGQVLTLDIAADVPTARFHAFTTVFPIAFHALDAMSPKAFTLVEDFIRPEPALIFTDAGPGDLRIPMYRRYAPLLKPGDFLLAHGDGVHFMPEDIDDLGLEPFWQENFDNLDTFIVSRRRPGVFVATGHFKVRG